MPMSISPVVISSTFFNVPSYILTFVPFPRHLPTPVGASIIVISLGLKPCRMRLVSGRHLMDTPFASGVVNASRPMPPVVMYSGWYSLCSNNSALYSCSCSSCCSISLGSFLGSTTFLRSGTTFATFATASWPLMTPFWASSGVALSESKQRMMSP